MNKQDPKQRKDMELRMDPEHIFKFACAQDVSCFTKCCQDFTIVLTIIHGFAVGLASNGIFDIPTLKGLLNAIDGWFRT